MLLDTLTGTAVLAAIDASTLVTNVQRFVGPILLLAIGVVAIKYLVSRQMTQFFQFLAIALLILVLFYVPGVLLAIVNIVTSFFGDGTQISNVSTGNTTVIPGAG